MITRPASPTHQLLHVIAPMQDDPDLLSLTTAMHSLCLDAAHPLALEIIATPEHRGFLIRAVDEAALLHAQTQLRARLPQAQFRTIPPEEDPLWIRVGEAVSVTELRAGAASYLPLQTFGEQRQAPERDPLLGLLAALDALPAGVRAVSQLALVPAPVTWSKTYQRKAIEDALEPEHLAAAQGRAGSTSRSHLLLLLLVGASMVLGLTVLQRHLLPLPLWASVEEHALRTTGRLVPLPAAAARQLEVQILIGGIILGPLLGGLLWLRHRLLSRPLYDRKLVAEQTGQLAYRARLRLYVLGPARLSVSVPAPFPWVQRVLGRVKRVVFHAFPPMGWQRLSTLGKRLEQDRRQRVQERAARAERRQVLARLIAAYRQFHLANGNFFVPHPRSPRLARSMSVQRQVDRGGRVHWVSGWSGHLRQSHLLLTVTALAALWHLPDATALPELAGVEQQRMHTRLVPPMLAQAALGRTVVGISEHAGHQVPFGLPPECLRSHLLICGKSGEGKSTFMEHLAQVAMQQDGLLLLDPHGDLVDRVLHLVPAHRLEEVILLDLSETDFAIGLNPLDVTMAQTRDKVISDLLVTLSHIWVSSWGSRMEIAFEYALRTLYEANERMVQADPVGGPARQYTLLDVMGLLTNEDAARQVLHQIQDILTQRWWRLYYDPLSQVMQRERTDPVLSKVAKFESQIARRIVGQAVTTLDLRACVREGKILLVKLAKGIVGEDVARLLGATILGLMQVALEEQAEQDPQQRRRLSILIDEFQVLRGVNWASLAELRKYGASFALATQSLEYLRDATEPILPTVLANVKQYALFHVSAQDAQLIAPDLGIHPEDLINLHSYHCYLRLTYAAQRQPTFSLRLLPPVPSTQAAQVEQIRQRCHLRYMRPAALVDEDLKTAIMRTLLAQPTAAPTAPSAPVPVGPPPRRARQDGGYRGRSPAPTRAGPPPVVPVPNAPLAHPMGWQETVGPLGQTAVLRQPTGTPGGADRPAGPSGTPEQDQEA